LILTISLLCGIVVLDHSQKVLGEPCSAETAKLFSRVARHLVTCQ